jgi:catechol 2,3-dioxygenase-like lactoylglutathione lyase family enzyme
LRLNHLDLHVPDVQALAAFFEQHFDFTQVSNGRSPAIAILRGRDDFSLVIQRRRADTDVYPDGAHLGFVLPSPDDVRAHHARMAAAGGSPGDVSVNARGTMFYTRAPGGVLVEVSSPG